MMSAYQWGIAHGSCEGALKDRKAYDEAHPGLGQPGYYLECEWGDRVAWQLEIIELSSTAKVALDKAVEKFMSRCITNHALHCEIADVEQWAQRWLSGVDRSKEAAQSAREKAEEETLAWAAADAAARMVAQAACVAADASAHAAGTMWMTQYEESARIADDIRSEIPKWPGEE